MDKIHGTNLPLLFLTHLINDSNIVIVSTILPLIVRDFQLTYLKAGLLANTVFISMIILQTLLGHLSHKFRPNYILGIGLVIMGFGGLVTVEANNYPTLLIGQLILGVGASFYHPIAYGLTEIIYGEKGRGKAFGIVTSAGDIGVLTVFILSGILTLYYNWRTPLSLFSILAISTGLTTLKTLNIDIKISEKRDANSYTYMKGVVLALIIYIMVVSINRLAYSYIPLLLSTWLPSQTTINLYISTMVFSGIIGEIATGLIIDKYSIKQYIIIVSIMMILSPLLLTQLQATVYTILPLIILGYTMYSYMPIIYGPLLGPNIRDKHGTIYGLTVSSGMIGGITTSIFAGHIADVYGLNKVPILMAIIASLTLLTSLTYYKIRRHNY